MGEPNSLSLTRTFPVKPKLKAKARTPKETPESKYWSSFKRHEIPNLVSSISSVSFCPTNPSIFSASHSTSLTLFSTETMAPTSAITSFRDVVSCASFRCDGLLIAASDLSGLVQVFDVKSRTPLRKLRSHSRPVHFVQYPVLDKLHLVSGGDDAVVKYWDVASQTPLLDFLGHKDYVRSGACSPSSMDMFVTGSYDHTVKLWDARTNSKSVLEVNHGKPVEDVIFLPSGGLVATAGGNSVKIWDVIGGGKMVGSMESHNKTVTSLCVGKLGKDSGEESDQFRILSVALDGYMKVFDYSKMKVTHSMRFPTPLMSVGFSLDCSSRVIGTSNGILYAGKRKTKGITASNLSNPWSLGSVGEPQRRALRPSHFRYFHRGQGEKPTEGDYLVMKPKKVKLTEHDKLLKKFRHKDALVSVLASKNPENVVAVMEELVARKKLLKCVSNLNTEELGLLLVFLQKHSTLPRYSSLLMGLTRKVLELRAEDIRASGALKDHTRNLKRSVDEEIRIQQSLLEIQGIISPLLRIAGR
ncbi:Protein SLOW WALKER 1, partial [Cucurbita argyrosperma subsp. sororia]